MYLILILLILIMLFVMFLMMNYKNLESKEKYSPFECGFDPFSLSRVPFSLKFFLIGIIFLVFDVEIVIIIPFPLLMMNKNLIFTLSFIMINVLIFLGLLYEYKFSMLDWLK
uniref:NADH-ubiquinone oxidoreductase chain 3 n=1 Tax=Dermacentor everestianus TaxID=1167514 RepID=A0A4D6QFG6_9ACAR|nr:NADH dehydrogenase subunit 3 [Dermacentor everestianus]QCF46398.1 NADH dehydrogenase subunit 3 [Dermacentor everestianus]